MSPGAVDQIRDSRGEFQMLDQNHGFRCQFQNGPRIWMPWGGNPGLGTPYMIVAGDDCSWFMVFGHEYLITCPTAN